LLMIKGADPGARDKQEMTALKYAEGLENNGVITVLGGVTYSQMFAR
jgi:hypothetical protein